MKICKNCQKSFDVTAEDLIFYEKTEVPEPTMCPACRQQRRLAFRNEINFFHRKCAKTGKQILSMYAPDSPYVIYDQEAWWKDDWDPMNYGRDFDFNRPFFEQFEELRRQVPRMSLNCIGNENSYYTNYALRNKNSYLVTTADYNEDSYYGRFSDRNFRCMDFDFTYDSRVCYSTIDLHRCQNCYYSQKLEGCSENYFCYDMRNCHNCIFSANQRNQSYLIFNKKVSPEEFKKFKEELKLHTWSGVQNARSRAREFLEQQPRKYLENVNCEECIGDYLKNSKNAKFCFDSYDLHDVKYCSIVFRIKDCYDWDFVGDNSERCYEMVSSAGENMFCRFCMNVWQSNSNLTYCDLCLFSADLFGCVGLRRKKYCILNKQYIKEEYEKMRKRVIEHMKRTGEWGEFFPMSMSPFAYNDSVALEYYPLGRAAARLLNNAPEGCNLTAGLKWRDHDQREYAAQTYQIPDDIKDVTDSLLKEMLSCEATGRARASGSRGPHEASLSNKCCGKNFKITEQEFSYYKEFQIPIPRSCWVCRHWQRRQLKNPRVPCDRVCAKCQSQVMTTYAPERPEPIYCEKCYLEFVA